MTDRLKNLMIALGAVLIISLGYFMFMRGDDEAALVATDLSSDTETQAFLVRMRSIENITVSTELFAEERFRSLIDTRQRLQDEPIGRPNPFAAFE